MNRSRLAALAAGAMFLVTSVFVPVTAMADTGNTSTIKVLPATTTISPAGTGSSFTVSVAANGNVAISGASAGLAFDNTKLTLTAIAKGAAVVTNGASFGGFPAAANMATFIANANSSGQIPNIGYFYSDGATFDAANTDVTIYTATFSVSAIGDSTLTPNQGPTIISGVVGGGYGNAVTINSVLNGTVVNHVAPVWSLSAPASATVLTGATVGVTLNTSVTSGSPGTISFAASGLPADGHVTASAASVSGVGSQSSTLTFDATAATSADVGTYSVTVTATDSEAPAVSHTAQISLQVVGNNDFSVGASPSSVSVNGGGSASSPVTVTTTVLTGTPGTIALSATGLPTGVTATFVPTSLTGAGTSSLTFLADNTAVGGVSTVTIHGNNGTYDHTTTVSLNVIVTPAGGQNVNVTGTLDSGFLGLTCPTSLAIPLIRGNTNQLNVPCQVYTNTVWNLNVNDTAADAYTGHMVTGRPVDNTTKFAIADSMHVLASPYLDPANNVAYHNNVDLSAGGSILTGTNSAAAPLVLSQYVRPSTHPGSYAIQVLFSAMSVF